MMNLLLKYEGYPPAVVAALCLHAFLLWIIFEKNFEPSEYVQIEQPMMAATAVQQNPQKLRRLEELQLQRQRELDAQRKREADQQAARQREAEAQRAREAEQKRVAEQQEKQRQQELERQRLAQQEADRQAREKAAAEAAERSRLLAEQQRQQQQAAEAAERQRLSEQNQAQAAEANIVSQYVSIIQNLIRQNWVIPPSARCNMVAVVELRLTPVGDVVSNTIVQSSGDAAFDRSVLQAVDRVGSFPEVRELPNPVFERNFRRFTLTFQPQDLLRC
jgi:colicin import membrane protein